MTLKLIVLLFLVGLGVAEPFYDDVDLAYAEEVSGKCAVTFEKCDDCSIFSEFLADWEYSSKYSFGSFDCSDMAQYIHYMLEHEGYNATMLGIYRKNRTDHMWVVVEHPKGGYCAIEPTCDMENSVGLVQYADWRFTGIVIETQDDLPYDRLWSLDPSEPEYIPVKSKLSGLPWLYCNLA